jgi:hypothetical protein
MGILPNTLLAGTPKSGTTTLWTYLCEHPDVYMAYEKELWFFLDDEVWSQGIGWYRRQFKRHKGEKIIGEATPLYFYSKKALNRISKTIPDVKLIFIFRNPVDRAFSHYWHNMRKRKDSISFEKAIGDEMKGKRVEKLTRGSLRYFDMGCYYSYLNKWYGRFPKKNIFIIIFEEMIANRDVVLSDLCRFLEINWFMFKGKEVNKNRGQYFRYRWMSWLYHDSRLKEMLTDKMPDSLKMALNWLRHDIAFTITKPRMSDEMREMLLVAYFEEINRLEMLLGKDLSVWRNKIVSRDCEHHTTDDELKRNS